MSVFLSLVLFCTTCPARKNPERRRWRGKATCGYVLRRDEDGPAWMEWAAMGHALHVAPAIVLRRRWSRTGWCSGRRRAAEWSTHVGAWTIVIIMGRYAFLAHVAHMHRVCFVQVPRTRYVFGAYVLTCQHVRVGHTDRTCWGSNTYALPERLVRVGVPAHTCCPSRSYALVYQRVRVACAAHTCCFIINVSLCFPLAVERHPLQVQGAAPLAL